MNRLWRAAPHPSLRSVIASWGYREADIEHRVFRPLPARPMHFIEFYLGKRITLIDFATGERTRPPGQAVIVGHQTQRVRDIELLGSFRTFTMHLVPSGLHRLCGVPMRQFTNDAFDAAAVLGNGVDDLLRQLQDTTTLEACVTLAERFIARRLDAVAPWNAIDDAAAGIARTGVANLPELIRASGLGARQFERRFAAAVGMPPATFLRVSRFHHAFERKDREPHARWTDIAADLGYYDQAHFVRDATALAGEPAGRLFDQLQRVDEIIMSPPMSYIS
jgi:AraC-like DNA-binding protein